MKELEQLLWHTVTNYNTTAHAPLANAAPHAIAVIPSWQELANRVQEQDGTLTRIDVLDVDDHEVEMLQHEEDEEKRKGFSAIYISYHNILLSLSFFYSFVSFAMFMFMAGTGTLYYIGFMFYLLLFLLLSLFSFPCGFVACLVSPISIVALLGTDPNAACLFPCTPLVKLLKMRWNSSKERMIQMVLIICIIGRITDVAFWAIFGIILVNRKLHAKQMIAWKAVLVTMACMVVVFAVHALAITHHIWFAVSNGYFSTNKYVYHIMYFQAYFDMFFLVTTIPWCILALVKK